MLGAEPLSSFSFSASRISMSSLATFFSSSALATPLAASVALVALWGGPDFAESTEPGDFEAVTAVEGLGNLSTSSFNSALNASISGLLGAAFSVSSASRGSFIPL